MFTDYINSSKFFPKYAPSVKRAYHKKRGFDSNNKPINFTIEDLTEIQKGIEQMKIDSDKEIELQKKMIKA